MPIPPPTSTERKIILMLGLVGLFCTILGAAGFEMPPGQWGGVFEKASGPLLAAGLVLLSLTARIIWFDHHKQ